MSRYPSHDPAGIGPNVLAQARSAVQADRTTRSGEDGPTVVADQIGDECTAGKQLNTKYPKKLCRYPRFPQRASSPRVGRADLPGQAADERAVVPVVVSVTSGDLAVWPPSIAGAARTRNRCAAASGCDPTRA